MRPRILQLGKFYPPDVGGIESVMQSIADGINAKGLVCDVLCSHKKWHFSYEITESSARIFRTKSLGKLASTSITPQMITLLGTLINSYDIIHMHLPDPMAHLALLLTKNAHKIIILHWHSDIIRQKYLLRCYAPLQERLLQRADYIIATSPKYLEQSPFLRAYQHKSISIPIGINPAHLQSRDNMHSHKDFYIDAIAPHKMHDMSFLRGKKMIFSLGRLAANKGFIYLIESAKHLSDEYVICIGGDGVQRAALEAYIAKNALQDKVFLLGAIPRETLAFYYEKCFIFVLPSLQESYGIVLLESMAFAKPVICTELCPSGSDWVNKHDESGLVIPPKDAKAIARAIDSIARDYERFSTGAKSRFARYFKEEMMIDSLYALYTRAYQTYMQTHIESTQGGGLKYLSCGCCLANGNKATLPWINIPSHSLISRITKNSLSPLECYDFIHHKSLKTCKTHIFYPTQNLHQTRHIKMADSSKAESAHYHSAPSTCHFLQVWVKSLRIARALSEKSRLDSKDVADSAICRHECDEAFCHTERSEVSHHIESSRDSSFALQTENDKNLDSVNQFSKFTHIKPTYLTQCIESIKGEYAA